MHEYSVLYHDRKNTYYCLAVLSGAIGIGIAFCINAINSSFGLTVAAPSGLAVFGILCLLFDKFIWSWNWLYSIGVIKIPNLNGEWIAEIKSSATGNEIEASVRIHQTYSKLRIHLETDKSDSLSNMAALEMANPTMFTLRYEYIAEFRRDENAQILRHYGVTSLRLKSHDHRFSDEQTAHYYTEQGRDSHGEITLSRKVSK